MQSLCRLVVTNNIFNPLPFCLFLQLGLPASVGHLLRVLSRRLSPISPHHGRTVLLNQPGPPTPTVQLHHRLLQHILRSLQRCNVLVWPRVPAHSPPPKPTVHGNSPPTRGNVPPPPSEFPHPDPHDPPPSTAQHIPQQQQAVVPCEQLDQQLHKQQANAAGEELRRRGLLTESGAVEQEPVCGQFCALGRVEQQGSSDSSKRLLFRASVCRGPLHAAAAGRISDDVREQDRTDACRCTGRGGLGGIL